MAKQTAEGFKPVSVADRSTKELRELRKSGKLKRGADGKPYILEPCCTPAAVAIVDSGAQVEED